jgi:hypothetical protein
LSIYDQVIKRSLGDPANKKAPKNGKSGGYSVRKTKKPLGSDYRDPVKKPTSSANTNSAPGTTPAPKKPVPAKVPRTLKPNTTFSGAGKAGGSGYGGGGGTYTIGPKSKNKYDFYQGFLK